jgi:metal-responsive CopG/Arc/MetJ family transcriptional regulator
MQKKSAPSKKEKVTVSLDADLLRLVDTFVEEVREAGISRSSVVEQALHLWKQELRDNFDAQYYAENKKGLADESWKTITTEAAGYIWRVGKE